VDIPRSATHEPFEQLDDPLYPALRRDFPELPRRRSCPRTAQRLCISFIDYQFQKTSSAATLNIEGTQRANTTHKRRQATQQEIHNSLIIAASNIVSLPVETGVIVF
jgi:hypothetical protein